MDIGGEGVTGAYAAVPVNINLEELRRLTGCIDAMEAFGAAAEARSTLSIRLGEGWDSASEAAAARFRDLFSGEVLGSTAAGTLLSPSMLRQMACAATLIPHVLGSNGEQLDQGEETVSYTHLDVYKRQPPWWPARRPCRSPLSRPGDRVRIPSR